VLRRRLDQQQQLDGPAGLALLPALGGEGGVVGVGGRGQQVLRGLAPLQPPDQRQRVHLQGVAELGVVVELPQVQRDAQPVGQPQQRPAQQDRREQRPTLAPLEEVSVRPPHSAANPRWFFAITVKRYRLRNSHDFS